MPRGHNIHTKHLDSEDRLRVRTLYFDAEMSLGQIVKKTGFSRGQVRHAIRAEKAEVGVRSGRPRKLTQAQEQELVDFVTSSREARRMGFLQLSITLFNAIFGIWAIKHALYRLGFRRRVARKKPPITETNRRKRLAWALEHKDWLPEQWAKILWTDETWVTGGTHSKQYVTRRPGEEWDTTCIVEKHQRKQGWMFWGCFSGSGKGPGLFWEKGWGKINAESYQAHTVPVMDGWIRLRQREGEELILMQDGAPGHAASSTRQDLRDRGVKVILWPPYSPDLNPIETCWDWMKDYIEDKYGLEEKPSYEMLRSYVCEAWDVLPDTYLAQLLATMPARCEAVIAANGMHTKY
jgi:transposase